MAVIVHWSLQCGREVLWKFSSELDCMMRLRCYEWITILIILNQWSVDLLDVMNVNCHHWRRKQECRCYHLFKERKKFAYSLVQWYLYKINLKYFCHSISQDILMIAPTSSILWTIEKKSVNFRRCSVRLRADELEIILSNELDSLFQHEKTSEYACQILYEHLVKHS